VHVCHRGGRGPGAGTRLGLGGGVRILVEDEMKSKVDRLECMLIAQILHSLRIY